MAKGVEQLPATASRQGRAEPLVILTAGFSDLEALGRSEARGRGLTLESKTLRETGMGSVFCRGKKLLEGWRHSCWVTWAGHCVPGKCSSPVLGSWL